MKKIFLCILDGFGYSKNEFGNATLAAPYITSLIRSREVLLLSASGKDVGLPDGQFGNSEVGHLTIGAGSILKQKLPMINDAISSGELSQDKTLNNFLKNLHNNVCHVMGLFSSGGVHSDISHFFWAIDLLRKKNIIVRAHLFLDGRDVGYQDAIGTLNNAINNRNIKISEIATIQGRFYAMDRDKRLDRTQLAYDAIVNGEAEFRTESPVSSIQGFYSKGIFDETIPPIVVNDYKGADLSDSFWMLNFRTDRIKQLLSMLLDKKGFNLLNMVDCDEEIDCRSKTIFKTPEIKNTLGEVLSKNGIKQLKVAETEKYAHVTYFMNGGIDIQFPLEDRILVPSPKVKDYAATPEMSSQQITEKIIEAMNNSSHQVIIANYANADMLGHTGNITAANEALRYLDINIKHVIQEAKTSGYTVILTADHGNAEEMVNYDGTPNKTHTCSLVPFLIIPQQQVMQTARTLADIAPIMLAMLGIQIPQEMNRPLIIKPVYNRAFCDIFKRSFYRYV